jgi:hypothetical protein
LRTAVVRQEAKGETPKSWFATAVMDFMTEHRGVVIVLVVLPLSFLMETCFEWRDWFYRTFQV